MRLLPPVAAAALALSLCAAPTQAHPVADTRAGSAAATPAEATYAKAPSLKVRKLVRGLDLPWDVKSIGSGKLLFTQRNRATLSTWKNGKTRKVKGFPSHRIWVSGETGLLGLAVDPDHADNGRVYTCQGWRRGGGHDIRVIAWSLDAKARHIRKEKVLVKGLPTTSGRHGGCRLLIAEDGSLLVGTGDAAVGTNPRNLDSLGGKTLRLNRFSGAPWPSNPYAGASSPRRFVHTFGHRNVQGLAERADGSLWSVEHGPDRDDEVNLLVNGGDYGWNPVPGYNESVPMTDHGLPGTQIDARWSSGSPTVATSGAAFVYGDGWRGFDGALAVACLKASRVIFMTFDSSGTLKRTRVPAALRKFGRLRGVTLAPDGALLVTTSNGGGSDSILRVTPA
ncbi:PQQ-dependent sugar dehydrogenase [Nocardioides dilutus]